MRSFIRRILRYLLRHVEQTNHQSIPFTKEHLQGEQYDIGEYTYGKPRVLFPKSGSKLKIGKFCSIAEGVLIFLGGNHRMDWISTYPFNVIHEDFPNGIGITGHPATKGDVVIGHDVWIGHDATILSGVTIGNGAVIAARSVVTKDVGAFEVWGGNPAKLIKKRFDEEKVELIQQSEWWNWEIDQINAIVPTLCSSNFNQLSDLKTARRDEKDV